MGELKPRAVIERYLAEVLNKANPASAAELIASQELRQRVDRFGAAFPDARTTTHHLLAEGDLVAVHLTGSGTHLGIFQGCPPTGRTWTATCTAIYRVEAGRIHDAWIHWDWLAVMEQLRCVQRAETVSA